jgi:hypothetical protein
MVTVTTALVQLLRARPNLAGVQVEYGWPGDAQVQDEVIYTGRARGTDEIANLRAGTKKRDETYDLDVLVEVAKPGGTQAEADQRCIDLFAELEDLLAENPRLGLAIHWARLASWEHIPAPTDDGRYAGRRGVVRFFARLT